MSVDEWDYREVCPDGGCVGVIGSDGTCKVCRRVSPTWGNERERGMVVDGADPDQDPGGDDEEEDDLDGDEEDADAALMPEAKADDHEWTRRQLCPDGACVGVIGASGVCSVCGKSPA